MFGPLFNRAASDEKRREVNSHFKRGSTWVPSIFIVDELVFDPKIPADEHGQIPVLSGRLPVMDSPDEKFYPVTLMMHSKNMERIGLSAVLKKGAWIEAHVCPADATGKTFDMLYFTEIPLVSLKQVYPEQAP